MRWSLEVAVRWDAVTARDIERYNQLANSPTEATWTIQLVNGTIWKGLGMPVGDVNGSTNEATMTLKVAGGGFCEKIFTPTV